MIFHPAFWRSKPRRYVFAVAAVSSIACGGPQCPSSLPSHEEVRRAHASSRAYLHAYSAEASVDRRTASGERIRGQMNLLLQKPDRLRIDTMSQFGPVSVLTAQNGNFDFVDLMNSQHIVGETCESNLQRLLELPLSAEDLLHTLTAEPVRSAPDEGLLDYTDTCRDGFLHFQRRIGAGWNQAIDFEIEAREHTLPGSEQHPRLRRLVLTNTQNAEVLRVDWDDYRVLVDPLSQCDGTQRSSARAVQSDEPFTDIEPAPIEVAQAADCQRYGIAMPHRIRIRTQNGTDVLLRIERLDLHPPSDDRVFEATYREGLEEIRMECQE